MVIFYYGYILLWLYFIMVIFYYGYILLWLYFIMVIFYFGYILVPLQASTHILTILAWFIGLNDSIKSESL